MIHNYFGAKNEWPEEIAGFHLDMSDNLGLTPKKSSKQLLSAFGGIIDALEEARIG